MTAQEKPFYNKTFTVLGDRRAEVSSTLPRGYKHATHFTKDGKPVISSRADEREVKSRAEWNGESIMRAREAYRE